MTQTEESKAELLKLCEKFIDDHRICCPEQIYQTDKIIEDAYELIEDICNTVGYIKEDDE